MHSLNYTLQSNPILPLPKYKVQWVCAKYIRCAYHVSAIIIGLMLPTLILIKGFSRSALIGQCMELRDNGSNFVTLKSLLRLHLREGRAKYLTLYLKP